MDRELAGARPPLRLGLVQFQPRKADPRGNLARIREHVARSGAGHDLLVFPEASLTGYFLEGGVTEVAISVEDLAEGLGRPPSGVGDLVVGFFERWRRGIHNSVAYLQPDGERYRTIHVHRKMFLPTYGIFQEARFADPGRDLAAFDTRARLDGYLRALRSVIGRHDILRTAVLWEGINGWVALGYPVYSGEVAVPAAASAE